MGIDAKLSLTQIAVLSALMVEARELSNHDLLELTGSSLTGEDRRRLVSGGLVDERREGRAYLFALSTEGWATGLTVLAEQARGKGAAATTVRMLLRGLDRGLAARGVDARTFFSGLDLAEPAAEPERGDYAASAPRPTDDAGSRSESPASSGIPSVDFIEERVRAGYAKLATEPSGWVSLADLRDVLDDIPRAEIDTALKWMAVQPGVRLIPVANLKSLSTRDREAALRFGGEENHAFAIEGS